MCGWYNGNPLTWLENENVQIPWVGTVSTASINFMTVNGPASTRSSTSSTPSFSPAKGWYNGNPLTWLENENAQTPWAGCFRLGVDERFEFVLVLPASRNERNILVC